MLKALSLGATACSFGKGYLFALGAGGQKGVEALLQRMKGQSKRFYLNNVPGFSSKAMQGDPL